MVNILFFSTYVQSAAGYFERITAIAVCARFLTGIILGAALCRAERGDVGAGIFCAAVLGICGADYAAVSLRILSDILHCSALGISVNSTVLS